MHMFSDDKLADRAFAIGLKGVVVFVLFFFSGFLISKLPNLSFFQSFESRTFQALLIVLPTFLAVILYSLLSICLIEKNIEEPKELFNPVMRIIVSVILLIILLLVSSNIKSFLHRTFSEETVNVTIFAIMTSLVFTIIESMEKKEIESIIFILLSLPLSTLFMIFISKGVVTLVRRNSGGQLADSLGNALLWMFALLINILLSFLFDSFAQKVRTEKTMN